MSNLFFFFFLLPIHTTPRLRTDGQTPQGHTMIYGMGYCEAMRHGPMYMRGRDVFFL
jgi:hypothetical protein